MANLLSLYGTIGLRKLGTILLAVLAGSITSGVLAVQDEPVQLTITDDDLPVIQLLIDGEHHLSFIVSTGSNFTVLHPATASLLDSDFSQDESAGVSFIEIAAASVAQRPLPVINAAVLGIDTAEDNVSGLLALHDLGLDRMAINFAEQLILQDIVAPAHHDGNRSRDLGLLLGHATVTGVDTPINVIIDSSSNYTVANQALKTRLQDRVRRTQIINDRELRGPRNDRRRLRDVPLRLRDLRVGGVCLNRVDASHVTSPLFQTLGWSDTPALIIGMDVLENAQLTVDFQTGLFALDPANRRARCPDEARVQRPIDPIDPSAG